MKKFITWLGASLALAVTGFAQRDETVNSPAYQYYLVGQGDGCKFAKGKYKFEGTDESMANRAGKWLIREGGLDQAHLHDYVVGWLEGFRGCKR